jgi:hypothetical protein
MLRNVKYLSFEINDICNLTDQHPQCPRNSKRFENSESEQPITVDDIVKFYRYCADTHGFKGLVNFHYYNEPLCTKEKIIEIIDRLPDARFSLWTNGLLLSGDYRKNVFLKAFDDVMITIYPYANLTTLANIRLHYPNVRFQEAHLDNRKDEDIKTEFNPCITKCARPDWELIIDYYGNGHVCCGDWKAEMKIGNILNMDYNEFIRNWKSWRDTLSKEWNEETYKFLPEICKICLARTPIMGMVSERDLPQRLERN